jgi:hypothetical protein
MRQGFDFETSAAKPVPFLELNAQIWPLEQSNTT